MILFITGSFPENQEGIASGAKVLLDAMTAESCENNFILMTTNTEIISNNIDKNVNCLYVLLKDWKVKKDNIREFYTVLDKYKITSIHMEYPGDLYGKTFLASFLPYLTKIYNKKYHKQVSFNVRLHEFSRARFLRKIAILPILWFSDRIYVPAKKDREIVSKLMKGNAIRTTIGTNIKVVSNELIESKKITISFFGSVYPGKGIEKMLSVWNCIHKEDCENKYTFKIIGDVGTETNNHFCSYHKQIWNLIEEYGLREVIEVTGYLSDEAVSSEIQNTQIATLLYEDGLTLRRGSFLAYLAHGVPIVTSWGDEEARELFEGHSGIRMVSSETEAISAIKEYSNISRDERAAIRDDNIELSKFFEWKRIAKTFLSDYGELYEEKK